MQKFEQLPPLTVATFPFEIFQFLEFSTSLIVREYKLQLSIFCVAVVQKKINR